jgi:hypothetical protein
MFSTDIKSDNKRASVEVMDTSLASIEQDQKDITPIDAAYLASSGLSKFYHSVLFQMALFGA